MINPKHLLSLLLLVALTALTGCVERTITIASDPPGALVFLNDVEVGRTPLKVPFTWYGEYDVRLRLERNEGTAEKPVIRRYYAHTSRKAEAPWFQWLGIDFFTELTPGDFKDEKIWAFALKPVVDPPAEELVERANALKERLGEPDELRDKTRKEVPTAGGANNPNWSASPSPTTQPK